MRAKSKILRETDARILIDRLLREAGWDIEDKNQVSTEEVAGKGRADYLLYDRRGRAIAIIEAKRFAVDPILAKQQAEEYANHVTAEFIFLTNGEDIYFWDYKNRPFQKIPAFFSQKDLERILALRNERKPLSLIPFQEELFFRGERIKIRPYQKEALERIDKAVEENKRKMLLIMATGTGKTLVAAMMIKRLIEAGVAQRVLFLVDRIELGQQAKETFDDYLKEYPSVLLYGGKRKQEGQIVIGTLPTIHSQLEAFSSGAFDLIISDEAHRSIYGIYNQVLTHFDAIRVGLTATPSFYINRNTYKLFGCWNEKEQRGEPTFAYDIRQGIDNGHLAGYEIMRIGTKISLEGLTYEGEDYSPESLEREINVPHRNEEIARAFKEEEEKRSPDRKRKTIFFAVTKNHAAQLARYLNEQYPEYNEKYAEVITSDVYEPERLIKKFKTEPLPIVAVSVGMLDTGFDAPEVENLAMVRLTRSPMLYQQMRGRGSRLCSKIGKTSFTIYDFVGNTELFNDESYNPYSKIQRSRAGRPWGVENEEETEKETGKKKRPFVQVPEDAKIEETVLVRKRIEVGHNGEHIDRLQYQNNWQEEIKERLEKDPRIEKIKKNQEITDEEIESLAKDLNSPQFYFNEANLREAFSYPQGTLTDFIKQALGIYQLPTEEQIKEDKINNLFEAWLTDKNFDAGKAKILRMAKNQYLVGEEVDVSIFNRPLFKQFGGLSAVIRIFGEKELKETVAELKENIFVK